MDGELNFEYIGFKDRVEPNSEESWKIKLKPKGEAQMAVTIYNSPLNIPNWIDAIYPKRKPSYEDRWVATHFSYRTYASSWKLKSDYIKKFEVDIRDIPLPLNSSKDEGSMEYSDDNLIFKPNATNR